MSCCPCVPARGHALMIGAAVLWGTVGLVVLRLHDHAHLSATQIACLRSLVAARWRRLALAGPAARRAPSAARPGRGLVVVVGAGTAAFQTLYFAAVPMVGVAVATLLASASRRCSSPPARRCCSACATAGRVGARRRRVGRRPGPARRPRRRRGRRPVARRLRAGRAVGRRLRRRHAASPGRAPAPSTRAR